MNRHKTIVQSVAPLPEEDIDKISQTYNGGLQKALLQGYSLGAKMVCKKVLAEIEQGRTTDEIKLLVNIALGAANEQGTDSTGTKENI